MESSDIKKLLAQSKKEPVNCAIAVNKEGESVILLHKIKAGTALVKDLEKGEGRITTPAFGQAFVDIDVDPKLVVLTLNHAPSGIAKKLKKTLAGTGYSKVEIRNEDGSVAEALGSDEVQQDEAATANAPIGATPEAAPPAGPTPHDLEPALADLIKKIPEAVTLVPALAGDLKQMAATAVSAVKGQDIAAATEALAALKKALDEAKAPAFDLKALQVELGLLIRQVAGAAAGDMKRLDQLKVLAGTAVEAVKTGDGPAADKSVTALRDAIAAAKTAKPQPRRAPGGPAPLAIWTEAKEAVDARIDALRKGILAHPDEALKDTLTQIADKGLKLVGDQMGRAVLVAMTEAETAPDKARKAVETLRTFLAGDIARGVDDNPFNVAVDLRGTLGTALEKIEGRLAA